MSDHVCACGAVNDLNFDRSLCACGMMHYFCSCGTQADPCDDKWELTYERVNPDDILIPARERNELRRALEQIRTLAAHNAEHHTGFVHIGRIAAAHIEDPA